MVLHSLFFKTYFLNRVYGSLDLDNLTLKCLNMLKGLICCLLHKYGYINYIFRKNGGCSFFFLQNIFLIGFTAVWSWTFFINMFQ